MPTYGYHCPNCDAEFEVRKRMTDATGADCPRCGTAGRRVFFPAGIVFKGSGFYKTDSRRASTASVGAGTSGVATAPSNGKSPSDGNAGEKASGGDRAPAGEKAPAAGSTSGAKKDGGASTTESGTST